MRPELQGVVRLRVMSIATAPAPALAFSYGQSNAAASGSASGVLGAILGRRFAQSLAFGERAKSLGIRPFGFAGDTARLWFSHQLAWDGGMRVRFRINHREGGVAVQHFESAELPAVMRALLSSRRLALSILGRIA